MRNTISELHRILGRLEECPLNVARVELQMFRSLIDRDPALSTVIQDVRRRNDKALGAKPATIADDPNSDWANLEFANTPELRAVVGYLVCCRLLDGYKGQSAFQPKLRDIGVIYFSKLRTGAGKPSDGEAIKQFARIFLVPLVSYLEAGLGVEQQILTLLSRYKQRCEWFADPSFATETEERRLKADFLRYLYDQGLDFSVEAEIPPGKGEVDILAVLPDGRQLPIEVKVFDGEHRTAIYVSRGLAQAAESARKFNSPSAYYLIYSIAKDTVLTTPGVALSANVVQAKVGGVDVYSVAANVHKLWQTSQAIKLKTVKVPPPDTG